MLIFISEISLLDLQFLATGTDRKNFFTNQRQEILERETGDTVLRFRVERQERVEVELGRLQGASWDPEANVAQDRHAPENCFSLISCF